MPKGMPRGRIGWVYRGGVERLYAMVAANTETGPFWKKLHPFLIWSTKVTIPVGRCGLNQ